MSKRVLITGGAGFIGSHTANELLRRGYRVRALDVLCPQVHGEERRRPAYLSKDVELIVGDVRDAETVREALRGIDAVYHFVALVGVGQSMYQVGEYTSVNNYGTSVLLEQLIKRPVEKLIVASSMSIYGEGLYRTASGQMREGQARGVKQLKTRDFELMDENGDPMVPVLTPESKTPDLSSIYALSKYDQERMCLLIGRAYGIPTVALRFFNAYGPFQALSNPYTGVLAIFASRLLNRKRPVIFEDGQQLRDFVSVYDVARACRLALESSKARDMVFNVGSGRQFTVSSVARELARTLNVDIEPEITGTYRVGDIRHCFPDISLASEVMGYMPETSFETGIKDLAAWLDKQIAHDRFMEMRAELGARGLVV